jgi:hypothetical protein
LVGTAISEVRDGEIGDVVVVEIDFETLMRSDDAVHRRVDDFGFGWRGQRQYSHARGAGGESVRSEPVIQ